ncbi:hypothetical protein [Embleya hyalina]|uniref:Uncharacterized protein n=1 Tax=Embleya hyalina TaxID=516124 RepID=A0A401YT78_9ACTN|nr:hypothetical protein [Embleya hyalina]GCD97794.1 hypothetical protein EHYA_05490 [Embleya hyalina]
MGETSGVPGGTNERRASSERHEQTVLTEYLGALAVRTEAAVRPRPAASARRRGRQRRLRRRIALGVAAAIVIVVSVLGVRSTDLGGALRGGPATSGPLTSRQLPPELAPWRLTHTSRNYKEFINVTSRQPTGTSTSQAPFTGDPCDDTRAIRGIRPAGIRHARMFRYSSETSPTASFSEIVVSFDDRAEALRVANGLYVWTDLCGMRSRIDQGGIVDVSLWRQGLGERVELSAIARRDSTVVFLLYTADARWQPQLPPAVAYAALARSSEAW